MHHNLIVNVKLNISFNRWTWCVYRKNLTKQSNQSIFRICG